MAAAAVLAGAIGPWLTDRDRAGVVAVAGVVGCRRRPRGGHRLSPRCWPRPTLPRSWSPPMRSRPAGGRRVPVASKQAHYLFVVNANQSTLLDRCQRLPWHRAPSWTAPVTAATAALSYAPSRPTASTPTSNNTIGSTRSPRPTGMGTTTLLIVSKRHPAGFPCVIWEALWFNALRRNAVGSRRHSTDSWPLSWGAACELARVGPVG